MTEKKLKRFSKEDGLKIGWELIIRITRDIYLLPIKKKELLSTELKGCVAVNKIVLRKECKYRILTECDKSLLKFEKTYYELIILKLFKFKLF